jgi:hypothetical protein
MALPTAALAETSKFEGYLKGHAEVGRSAADMVRARAEMMNAQANMLKAHAESQTKLAEAAKIMEEARSLALDNDLKRADTFYKKRQLHDANDLDTCLPPSPGELQQRAEAAAPARLKRYEYDPSRGEIYWPPALRQDRFFEVRVLLDALFARRTSIEAEGRENFCAQVREAADRMRGQLHEQIDDLPPDQYIQARRFLESLVRESQLPPVSEGIAGGRAAPESRS